MMALQAIGTIQEMEPSLEDIETSKTVTKFTARFIPNETLEAIHQDLDRISEIDSDEMLESGEISGAKGEITVT